MFTIARCEDCCRQTQGLWESTPRKLALWSSALPQAPHLVSSRRSCICSSTICSEIQSDSFYDLDSLKHITDRHNHYRWAELAGEESQASVSSCTSRTRGSQKKCDPSSRRTVRTVKGGHSRRSSPCMTLTVAYFFFIRILIIVLLSCLRY